MRLVLLPGMDGTGSLFLDFSSALGPNAKSTIVRYPTDRALGYTELEDIARSFLPEDSPYILLAESFSGPIAISIAASSPTGLVGLVLCCSFARNPRRLLGAFLWLLDLLRPSRISMAVLSKLLLGRLSSGRLRSQLRQALDQVSKGVLRARLRAVLEVDVSAKLRHVEVPILYLRASEDRLVPPAAADHISRSAPRARVAELCAPHLLLQTVPVAAAAVVNQFLHEIASR
jgi:pimeloyl-[acyl-carrier protein] methyl ester esterase